MMQNDDANIPPSPLGLEQLAGAARKAGGERRQPPPVHLWNPPFCGDIDMRIARDGVWHYNGSPIGRPALVQLFSTILRRDQDRYVLVTPVERVGIQVEDAPFLGVELRREITDLGQTLHLRTNVEDWATIGPDHPLRFEDGPAGGLKPYVRIRGDLWALVKRALFYDLAEWGEKKIVSECEMFGVSSMGVFFPMAPVSALGEFF